MDLGGFRWISWIPGVEGLSTCGGVKTGAATPLTNLCSDAGVGRLEAWMPGCLDIWYSGVFMWFYLHLGGFRWISWIPGAEGLSTCGGVSGRAAAPLRNLCSAAGVGRLVDSKAERDPGLLQPLTKTCGPYSKMSRLQSCRFGGLDAWMPGCQQAWRLEAWILDPWGLVGLLAGWQDWIGLDLNGC